jgi:hypothetical protein
MKAKPWQIALIAVGLLIGVASIMYNVFASGAATADLPYSMFLLDVETGKIYSVGDYRSAAITLPELRPKTELAALVPVNRQPDGSFVLPQTANNLLTQLQVPVKAVDPETGVVNASGSPETFSR